MKLDKNYHIIKVLIEKELPNSEIILFGSKARNDDTRDSDYDILILISQELSPKEKIPYKTSIRKSLLDAGIRSDILIQSKNEAKKKAVLPGHIIQNAINEGITIS